MIKCFAVWLYRANFICLAADRRKMITWVVEMINVEYQMKNVQVFFELWFCVGNFRHSDRQHALI